MLVETLLGALGALLVLIFVFRSFMAIVPLLMAAVAIPTTFLLIWPIASVTDVSVIVQFLVALIGLGIAIDYALLVVVRWREERRGGEVANETAVRNAMQHAGSAVVFSGTTVAISLLVAARPADARPAQHRHRRPADRARQRRRRQHPPARRPGHRRPVARPAPLQPGPEREPRLVCLGADRRPTPLDRRDRLDRRPRRARARRLADPARRPAGRLARPEGPRARRPRAAEGLRHRHRAAVTVRSSRPLRQPGSRRAAIAKVDGVQTTVAPADWRRDGTAIVTIIPTAGRQLGGRPRDARPDPRRRDRRRDRAAAKRRRAPTSSTPSTATSR